MTNIRIEAGYPARNLDQLVVIDNIIFPDISVDDQGTRGAWVNEKGFIGAIAKNGDDIIGYCDVVRINEQGEKTICGGTLRDGEISRYAKELSATGEAVFYLIMIAVLPNFRGKGIAANLWDFVTEQVRQYGVKNARCYATAWTSEGERFISRFAHAQVITHDALGHSTFMFQITKNNSEK